ncbi:hypothetical protein LJR228_001131 [Mesorhizobium caraganae]
MYIAKLLALPSQVSASWPVGNSQSEAIEVVQLVKDGIARRIRAPESPVPVTVCELLAKPFGRSQRSRRVALCEPAASPMKSIQREVNHTFNNRRRVNLPAVLGHAESVRGSSS